MSIQLILLALLLIIGVYELYTLSFQEKLEKDLPMFWKKSLRTSKLLEKGLKTSYLHKL